MGRAKGGSDAAGLAEIDSRFLSVLGARRGNAGYRAQAPGVEVFARLRRALRDDPSVIGRDEADELSGLLADRSAPKSQVRDLLTVMWELPSAVLTGPLRAPLQTLADRFAQAPITPDELSSALSLVGRRSRRERAAERPVLLPVVDAITARYVAGDLSPMAARDLSSMLWRQPEYDQLAQALIDKGRAGEPEALNALHRLMREATLSRALKAQRELGARIAGAGLPQAPSSRAQRTAPALRRARDGAERVKLDARQRAEASVAYPYPKGFAAGHPFIARHLLDVAVENLPGWDAYRVKDAAAALRVLLAEAPTTGPQDAQLVSAPGYPLHAVIIERLPDWSPPRDIGRNGPQARHRDHVAIGIYVYDTATATWYKRAVHGRRKADGVGRSPFATSRTALATAEHYIELLTAGQYQAAAALGRGYPRKFAQANAELAATVNADRSQSG